MSVYGGFSTRKQQVKYYSLLEQMVLLMETALCRYVLKQDVDSSIFKMHFQGFYQQMSALEEHKYMQPKFTTCLCKLNDIFAQTSLSRETVPQKKKKKLTHRSQKSDEISIRSPDQKSLSGSNNNINYFPVTNIYNMKWPSKQITAKELNTIHEQLKNTEEQVPIRSKRIQSGVTHIHKENNSRQNIRPNTSIRRNQTAHEASNTIEFQQSETNNNKSRNQTIYLVEQYNKSISDIPVPKKKLYYQLERYQTVSPMRQPEVLAKFSKRKRTSKIYKIAKLF